MTDNGMIEAFRGRLKIARKSPGDEEVASLKRELPAVKILASRELFTG